MEKISSIYFPDPDEEAEHSYKYDKRMRQLPIDSEGKWIRRHKNWRPNDVPDWMWKEATSSEKEFTRREMLKTKGLK